MTTAAHPVLHGDALAPVRCAISATFGTGHLPGVAPNLLVSDSTGWLSATELVDGFRVPELLDAATQRWQATPPTAAALAWKAYTYWLALPPVLGWAAVRRVPLMRPEDVLVHIAGHRPLLTIGLRPTVQVAVLPNDPLVLAATAHQNTLRDVVVAPNMVVVPDEAALLGALRANLLDAHLRPLMEQLQRRVRLGTRTLLGSLASAVAYGVIRAADRLPGSTIGNAGPLLDALDVADLVELVPIPDGGWTVRRKTCCLAFTLPEPKICAGCCIRPAS